MDRLLVGLSVEDDVSTIGGTLVFFLLQLDFKQRTYSILTSSNSLENSTGIKLVGQNLNASIFTFFCLQMPEQQEVSIKSEAKNSPSSPYAKKDLILPNNFSRSN
jgi:hypothetical protein